MKGTKLRHRFPLVLSSNTGGKYERATVSTISHRSLCSSASAIFLVYRVCLLPPADKKRKSRLETPGEAISVIWPRYILPLPFNFTSTRRISGLANTNILEGNVTIDTHFFSYENVKNCCEIASVKSSELIVCGKHENSARSIVIVSTRGKMFSTWLVHEEIDHTRLVYAHQLPDTPCISLYNSPEGGKDEERT